MEYFCPWPAVLGVTREGRKQRSLWLWPVGLLWQKFCIYERRAAALPATLGFLENFSTNESYQPTHLSTKASFVYPEHIVFICSKSL